MPPRAPPGLPDHLGAGGRGEPRLSADALAYAKGAIAASTLKSYDTAGGFFVRYCEENGFPTTHATADSAASWLASMAKESGRAASTIATYRSGARYWHSVQTRWQGANPFDGELTAQVVKGIKRERKPGEVAARRAVPPPFHVTPQLLLELKAQLLAPRHGPAGPMHWAAACLATFALARPGEIVGGVGQEDRAMRRDQIVFYRWKDQQALAPMLPLGHSASAPTTPHRFTIDFGIVKNDQAADKPPHPIDAPLAVAALWQWVHLRRDLGVTADELFCLPGQSRLSKAGLLRALMEARADKGLAPRKILGRAFRQGGCAALVRDGTPMKDIQASGRWSGQPMVNLYAGAAAISARAAADLAAAAARL